MGCATSKGLGVSPEPSRAQVDHGNKPTEMRLAGGSPRALAATPPSTAAARGGEAPSQPSATARDPSFDPTSDQGGSGQSSGFLTLTGSGRSLHCIGVKGAPEPEAADVRPEAGAERLAAVRLFCATPPADCCSSVSA